MKKITVKSILTNSLNKNRVISKSENEITFDLIDKDFLDLIYFHNVNEREDYLNEINNLFKSLNLKQGDDIVDVRNKITDYLILNKNISIDFIFEILKEKHIVYNKHFNKSTNSYEVEEISIIQSNLKNKISGFYQGLKFGITNIKRKLNHNFLDFNFEENIILHEINKIKRAFSIKKEHLLEIMFF